MSISLNKVLLKQDVKVDAKRAKRMIIDVEHIGERNEEKSAVIDQVSKRGQRNQNEILFDKQANCFPLRKVHTTHV